MDLGYVILCPDRNIGGIQNSFGSIKYHCDSRDCIAVVGQDVTKEELKEMEKICPTFNAGSTITSLINIGMKKTKNEWAFLMFSGSRIQHFLERKLTFFAKNMKDVLFPVVDRRCNFVDGSFNGVLINTKFFTEVGEFPTQTADKSNINDFELAKMLWACQALENGVRFKAIVGMKII